MAKLKGRQNKASLSTAACCKKLFLVQNNLAAALMEANVILVRRCCNDKGGGRCDYQIQKAALERGAACGLASKVDDLFRGNRP